jgi:hypothetical protein
VNGAARSAFWFAAGRVFRRAARGVLWRGAGVALLAAAGLSCSSGRGPATAAGASAAPARVWNYEVEVGPHAEQLRVHAQLPPGVPGVLGVDRFAHPFLVDLELKSAGGWRPIPNTGAEWQVPECRERGCELRYRYSLAQAAARIDRFEFAGVRGGVLLAPPSTWLLHPRDYTGADRYSFRIRTETSLGFASGVPLSARGDGSREGPAELLFQAPYSGFADFRQEQMEVPGGQIQLSVGLAGAPLALSPEALSSALREAAALVSDYFGRFPVRELAVIVVPSDGSEMFGMQLGNGGASILLFMGRGVQDVSPRQDWVLVHEMFHLGFPSVIRRHVWLAEGLATYQEPLARARAGLIDEQQLWAEFFDGMPKGLPGPGDGGLDGTRSWGRTYWGGALFCLLADLAIRSQSEQRFSLDDAMRGILAAGGDTAVRWTMLETLATGDRAIGASTLVDLYREHAAQAVAVDLPALFRKLGVRRQGQQVLFDDDAEWAPLRRALTAPRRATAARTLQPLPHGAQLGLAVPGVPKSPL